MKFKIDIFKKDKGWKEYKFITKTYLSKVLKLLTKEIGFFQNTDSLELTILLTNNHKISQLNKDFLNKIGPTNVLSFPDRNLNYNNITTEDFKGDIILGDIAFGLEIIIEELQQYNLTLEKHFTHLLVHAILHLIGYDHENKHDFQAMKDLEISILDKLGIDKPSIYA